MVERASKGRSSAAAQSKLNAAEAHHGLLHHTRRLLLAALPRALRDATPRRLMALLHSLQEQQPELRLEPGVEVQVVQLLVQGLMGAHRRFLSDCSAKELVELAALLQASPDWRQHVTPSLVQGLQAALRRTVLAKSTPAPAANGALIKHSTTPAATTSQELTVLPDQVPAAAQLTSFLMALPQVAWQPPGWQQRWAVEAAIQEHSWAAGDAELVKGLLVAGLAPQLARVKLIATGKKAQGSVRQRVGKGKVEGKYMV
ncbi:hypothetical protein HaLaN_16791, partial [Haematococcus lacustris]